MKLPHEDAYLFAQGKKTQLYLCNAMTLLQGYSPSVKVPVTQTHTQEAPESLLGLGIIVACKQYELKVIIQHVYTQGITYSYMCTRHESSFAYRDSREEDACALSSSQGYEHPHKTVQYSLIIHHLYNYFAANTMVHIICFLFSLQVLLESAQTVCLNEAIKNSDSAIHLHLKNE